MAKELGPDVDSYLGSVARELEADAYRVRCLIGDKHWLSDGTHKEAVLAGVLARFIPSDFLIAKGFVRARGREVRLSTEQDILIVDTSSEAPLFQEYGLAICCPENLLASVSVKSGFSMREVKSSVEGWQSTTTGIGIFGDIPSIFYGAYFFNGDKQPPISTIKSTAEYMLSTPATPGRDDLPAGIESVIACSSGCVFVCRRSNEGKRQVVVHQGGRMAPVFLIANVAHSASLRRGGGKPELVSQLEDLRFPKLHDLVDDHQHPL